MLERAVVTHGPVHVGLGYFAECGEMLGRGGRGVHGKLGKKPKYKNGLSGRTEEKEGEEG